MTVQELVADVRERIPATTSPATRPPAGEARAGRPVARLSLPLIVVAIGLGTLLISIGYAGGRSGATWAQVPFWAGQVISFVAVALAVTSPSISERGRLAVVLLQAAQQSLVWWMYSPLFFSFPDELQHYRTAHDILITHHLFHTNPTLPVSAVFPGLEEVTSALVSLTHVSIFTAGIAVVSTAHVALAAAIYLLAKRVTGDARVASVAAVLYAINPDQAGFNTQFIYQVPALLFCVAGLHMALGGHRRRAVEGFPALACLAAVIVTHHVTAAVTLGALTAIGVLTAIQTRFGPVARRLLWLAVAGLLIAGAWIWGVASSTIGYLSTPITDALGLGASGGGAGGAPGAAAAPTTGGPFGTSLEIAGVAALAGLLVVGCWLLLSRRAQLPRRPLTRAFALLAMSYFGVLLIRVVASDGAELATRLFTFSAIFTSAIAAIAIVHGRRLMPRFAAWVRPLAIAVMIIVFLGASIGGWPPQWEVVPGQFRIAGFESGIDRQNTAAVDWFYSHVGPGRHVACDFSTCALLGAYADADPIGDASQIFYAPRVTLSVIRMIESKDIQYVFVDRRMSEQTPVTGSYFARDSEAGEHYKPVPVAALEKFAITPGVRQIYDSGPIAIYDVRGLLHV